MSTDKQKTKQAEVEGAEEGGAAVNSQSTGGLIAFIFLALIVALAVGSFSFYLFQQLEDHKAELADIKVELSGKVKGSLNNVTGQFSTVSERFNNVTDRMSGFGGDIKNINQKLGSEVKGLNDKINTESKALNEKLSAEVIGLSQKIEGQVNSLQGEIKTQAEQQRQLDDGLHKLNQFSQDLQREQQTNHEQLVQSLDKLYKEKGRQRSGWILSEVEYLMLIANHSLRLSRDVNTALIALESADQRLLDMGDPGVIDIRKAITDEVVQLRAVPKVDIAGMAAQLTSLIKQANDLAVQHDKLPEFKEEDYLLRDKAEPTTLEKAKTKAEEAGRKFIKELENLVAFRSSKGDVHPLIAPKEKYFLQQNLILKLESARSALLNQQQAMYQSLLAEAKAWLSKYFVAETSQVKNLQELISGLEGAQISPQLPDISFSLKALRGYMQELEKHAGEEAQVAQKKEGVE